MKKFEREDRYIVIKRKDLTREEEELVLDSLKDLSIRTIDCVVVEADWPEYEPVWAMIEARMGEG